MIGKISLVEALVLNNALACSCFPLYKCNTVSFKLLKLIILCAGIS